MAASIQESSKVPDVWEAVLRGTSAAEETEKRGKLRLRKQGLTGVRSGHVRSDNIVDLRYPEHPSHLSSIKYFSSLARFLMDPG